MTFALALTVASLLLASPPASGQGSTPSTWLDRPLTNWNSPGTSIPTAPASDEPVASVIIRCQLTPPRTTGPARAVEAAGWIPFWNFDQQLVRDDVEIVGGMRGADGMCRPISFNLFVFVGGRFAGTLSPGDMSSRLDGSAGAVRLSPPQISAEFARYQPTDPLCCPSSRMTVRYRIDRDSAGPVVVPVEVRPTRP